MNLSKALLICNNLDSTDFTEQEKNYAINIIIKVGTYNDVTKEIMINIIKYLYNK